MDVNHGIGTIWAFIRHGDWASGLEFSGNWGVMAY
jgi:hypothetical protein